MFYFRFNEYGKIEEVFEVQGINYVAMLPSKITEANEKAGFMQYVSENNVANKYFHELCEFAKEQKWRADTAELKLEAAEYFNDEE